MLTGKEFVLRVETITRFIANIDVRGEDECWPFMGARIPDGYGQFWSKETGHILAHRLAWVIENGFIPEGQLIRHKKCDNPPCCNISHLEPGSQKQNMEDMELGGRANRRFGENAAHAKLTNYQSDHVKILYATGLYRLCDLAAMYQVSTSSIAYSVKDKRKGGTVKGDVSRRQTNYTITDEDCSRIRFVCRGMVLRTSEATVLLKQLAEEYNCGTRCIRDIATGRTRKKLDASHSEQE